MTKPEPCVFCRDPDPEIDDGLRDGPLCAFVACRNIDCQAMGPAVQHENQDTRQQLAVRRWNTRLGCPGDYILDGPTR